jgi:hypothetical protein
MPSVFLFVCTYSRIWQSVAYNEVTVTLTFDHMVKYLTFHGITLDYLCTSQSEMYENEVIVAMIFDLKVQ